MESLINQAFNHVDTIGPLVMEGHYDLVGPNNEIILPGLWEKVIEPDWTVTMHLWPMPEPEGEESRAAQGNTRSVPSSTSKFSPKSPAEAPKPRKAKAHRKARTFPRKWDAAPCKHEAKEEDIG